MYFVLQCRQCLAEFGPKNSQAIVYLLNVVFPSHLAAIKCQEIADYRRLQFAQRLRVPPQLFLRMLSSWAVAQGLQ